MASSRFFFIFPLTILLLLPSAFPEKHNSSNSVSSSSSAQAQAQAQINSNSVLVGLLDSHYTEFAELVEKALLLQSLEDVVGKHNITIFAPVNEAIDRSIDPEFKRFLLQPGNLKSLQKLLLHHIVPKRIESAHWADSAITSESTLSREKVRIARDAKGETTVGKVRVIDAGHVSRPDGVIHGIERLILPLSVVQDFNKRRVLESITAVKPEGAPEIDPKTNRLKKPAPPAQPGSAPVLPIFYAMAPGPSLAPAPAPGPGGPHHHFNGHAQVKDFIQTLLQYGGYNEMADILVNLTSLATEMGRLVSEGYVLTVLAPNDEAMAKLSAEQLSESGAPEEMMYYHIIPEYQTEESMYNAVRRFGKVRYETLRVPHRVVAEEADGSVKFGQGEDGSAYLFDPDIYTDGRISVQGIDGVLFPVQDKSPKKETTATTEVKKVKVVAKPRRGKLLEVACRMVAAVGRDSHFSTCQ